MGRGVQRGLNFNNHIGHIHNRVWPLFFEILCTIYLIESIKKSVWAGLRNDVLKIWAAEPVKPEAAGSSPVAPAEKSKGLQVVTVVPFLLCLNFAQIIGQSPEFGFLFLRILTLCRFEPKSILIPPCRL